MAEPTDAQLMAGRVAFAKSQLNDGAVAVQVLEDLWRAAYAVGVRAGQRKPSEGKKVLLARRTDGWQYGPFSATGLARGDKFTYGGMDQAGHTVERPAMVTSVAGELRMFLADTGEQLKFPAGTFWVKLADQDDGLSCDCGQPGANHR